MIRTDGYCVKQEPVCHKMPYYSFEKKCIDDPRD